MKKEQLFRDVENNHLWLNKDGSIIYSEQSDDDEFLAHVEQDYEFNNELYYQDI